MTGAPGLPEFALERWFARWEFTARRNLGASDVEPVTMAELLALADDEGRDLWDGLSLGYTESAGHPRLREEIAGLYETAGPDDVLVCSGAEEAILLVAGALAEPGARVVCLQPSYASLHEVARARGADVRDVTLDPARGWALDLDAFRDALGGRARMAVLNLPHSPTGALPPPGDLAALAEMTAAAGAHLVGDEVYRLLERDPADRLPAAADVHERGVSIGVMSKAFGLPGLRIGWVATRDRALLRRLAAMKDWTTICAAAPSEALAIIALRAREALLDRARALVATGLRAAEDLVAAHPGALEWIPPRA
ncbi:MAG: aminotransferase class I/II-fold pyridoxal phosphate-dependent enzyme, partial [Thermoleophilia bacterium]